MGWEAVEWIQLAPDRDTLQALVARVTSVQLQAQCPRGFQEVKVPRLRDNGTGWW